MGQIHLRRSSCYKALAPKGAEYTFDMDCLLQSSSPDGGRRFSCYKAVAPAVAGQAPMGQNIPLIWIAFASITEMKKRRSVIDPASPCAPAPGNRQTICEKNG